MTLDGVVERPTGDLDLSVSPSRRVGLYTLGCKVNQYETEKLAGEFRSAGFDVVPFSAKADVYVVNSCTVTHTADGKSRQAVRSALNRNPSALVVLTGCYAETSAEEASRVDGVSLVLGNSDKPYLVARVSELAGRPSSIGLGIRDDSGSFRHLVFPSSSLQRTRALIKVQDGCDQFCAYCAVPMARPKMLCKPFHEVVTEAEGLASLGHREIVLTGIRLGRYESEGVGLTELLVALTQVGGIERVRLSSIEVTDIPVGMLELMAANRKICRHLHVPLQSGSNAVLKRMNRPYTAERFVEFAAKAWGLVPGIAITSDIIVGFPGETEQDFLETGRLIEEIGFSRLHVFKFSPRRGTVAAELKDDVLPADKSRRSAKLIELGVSGSRAFAEKLVGATVPVLVEAKKTADGRRSGLTDTYIRVFFEAGASEIGRIIGVQIEAATDSFAHGRLCG
jgi:threonylcarbamoyladenosine tRNA methylthiotransferase MtaB